ncbi:predicted protein [Naegleria gruberi]|uniref:Predicted protein n=1 Tax=Naegleria gruberi TaxID=5762 RepID=D2V745_NAEGR|nr:uncharacterized protein NAEGRDRAFT_64665 [Naegleria gruberi]EFC47196.1 predicted protein [Naegleria gruberi]|eukprot:XP_002679940.1 predicted protein [Naegleria gruberi strain NEG-M]
MQSLLLWNRTTHQQQQQYLNNYYQQQSYYHTCSIVRNVVDPAGWTIPEKNSSGSIASEEDNLKKRITVLINSFIKKNESIQIKHPETTSENSQNDIPQSNTPEMNASITKLQNSTFSICDRIFMLVERYGEYLSEGTVHRVLEHFASMHQHKLNVLIVFSYLNPQTSNGEKKRQINLRLSSSYGPLLESYGKLHLFQNMTHIFSAITNSLTTVKCNDLESIRVNMRKRNQIVNSFLYNFSSNGGPLTILYRTLREERSKRLEFFHEYEKNLPTDETRSREEIFIQDFDISWDPKAISSYFMIQNTNVDIAKRLFDIMSSKNCITRAELSEMVRKYVFKFRMPKKAEDLLLEFSVNSSIKPTFEDYAVIIVGYINTNQLTLAFKLLKKLIDSSRIRHRTYSKAELTNFISIISILIRQTVDPNIISLIANISADIFFESFEANSDHLLQLLKEIRNDRQIRKHILHFAVTFNEQWAKLILERNYPRASLVDEKVSNYILEQFTTNEDVKIALEILKQIKEKNETLKIKKKTE